MLHIFISAAGEPTSGPGSTGRAVPGLRRDDRRRRRHASCLPGQPGRLAVRGPTGCRYLDDPRQAAYVQQRLEPDRRHVLARRRRLLLVPGAQRRHDHQLGLQHRGAGGRGGAAQAPAGRGVRGGRHPRRGARPPREGVRRERRRGDRRASCRTSSRPRSRPTSTRARSSSSPSCPRPRPGSCSASGSAIGRRSSPRRSRLRLPLMPDHSPRHLILSLFGLYARDAERQLAVGALADRADGGPRRRRGRDPVVGVAAEEARRARAGARPTARRATGCRRRRSPCSREGDARIWSRPRASVDDGWLVVVFSVPEAERGKRHELRSLLTRLGFGTAAPGVWVAPGTAYDETLARARPRRADVVHRAVPRRLPRLRARPTPASASGGTCRRSPRCTTSSWPTTARLTRLRDPDPARAFAAYVPMLTAWRRLPYLDPGIPLELLPAGWPGQPAPASCSPSSTSACASPAAKHAHSTAGVMTRSAADGVEPALLTGELGG